MPDRLSLPLLRQRQRNGDRAPRDLTKTVGSTVPATSGAQTNATGEPGVPFLAVDVTATEVAVGTPTFFGDPELVFPEITPTL